MVRLFLLLSLAACSAPQTPIVAESSPSESKPARYDPAPTPRVHPRSGSVAGALELPIPFKMPPGTGAVPVGAGAVRGSIVSGFRGSF